MSDASMGTGHQGSGGAAHQGSAGAAHQGSGEAAHRGSAGAAHQGSGGAAHRGSGGAAHQGSAGTSHQALAPAGHHFATLEQEHEANLLGMWVFLATEVLFFGAMFTAYFVYRGLFAQVFSEASHHLDLPAGGINTGVLLTSSLTMALAVHAAQLGERRRVGTLLAITALLGLVFLGIKGLEYGHKIDEQLFPGLGFHWEGPQPGQAHLFFVFYIFLTGLHALHVLIGVVIIGPLAVLARRGWFAAPHYQPVEVVGLYWHFVDIVWIFLYPLLYLVA